MTSDSGNVLIIMSDEHARFASGRYGHPLVRTPNLDALADEGVIFDAAYCNSPICVPSRASVATGRYVHQIGCWDNAMPYAGQRPSWAHRLNNAGVKCDSVGKLHYLNTGCGGFAEEHLPMHVVDGIGDAKGMLRRPPFKRPTTSRLAGDVGVGESPYFRYDRDITATASNWIRSRSNTTQWALFVGLTCPHFPLIAPARYSDLYPSNAIELPRLHSANHIPSHPALKQLREVQNYGDFFADAQHIRRALAAYYGLVTHIDDCVGELLVALKESGAEANTTVIYTSDHGDNLGTRSFWGKSTMFEESVGVPLIMRGPNIPRAERVSTPVSLIDLFPTILDVAGVHLGPDDKDLPGTSLLAVAQGRDSGRTAFSEYHAIGAVTGVFMVRSGQYKYIHYEGYDPQIFDMTEDPGETRDIFDAVSPQLRKLLRDELFSICRPDLVDSQAFSDQRERIQQLGGEESIKRRESFHFTPVPSMPQEGMQ